MPLISIFIAKGLAISSLSISLNTFTLRKSSIKKRKDKTANKKGIAILKETLKRLRPLPLYSFKEIIRTLVLL